MGLDSPLHVGSAIRGLFGPAMWLALVMHLFGAEIYVSA